MSLLLKIITTLMVFMSVSSGQYHNNNFDFSAIDTFWKIHHELKNNREPSQDLWNELFSNPGYKVLTNREYTKEFFIQKFRIAFSPKYSLEYEDKLNDPSEAYYLKHYKNVENKRAELSRQIQKLQKSNLNQRLLNMVMNYLPERNINTYPDVAFVIFANDGRGYNPIVIDLYASIDWDYISFLAHEYHHWYRNSFPKFNFSLVDKSEYVLVEVLSLIEAEGVADQIDKAGWFTKSNPDTRESGYIRAVNNSPEIIKKMNALLEQIVDRRENISEIGSKIKNLVPNGGHPTGFFMAKSIIDALGRNELIKTVGNPFEFVKQYNNAARMQKNCPVFSSKAMKIVAELERKYILH